MNDIDRTLNPTGSNICLAADGSGTSGAPRDNDPERSSLVLGDMLEMGLESLLMHFRRKPQDQGPLDGSSRPE